MAYKITIGDISNKRTI